MEEHIAGWKKQKLRTSSERSHLGFPDMKAATASKHLATIDLNLRQLPYRHGFAMPAYKNFTDFQILKKAAVFEVEKMRTIQLMPAAFNMNNKKTGKEAMRRAEALQLLPDEQAGSRKGHRSILTALNKVLTNDLIRARRIPGVMIFNDAKSCYDRIVLWLAALALRRLGTSKPATLEMMETLQGAQHKICTAYGDSNHSYGGEFTYPPLQGVGQGNGAGPAIWVAISSVLLSIMRMKGFGFSVLSALALKALSIAGFAFVDDIDIIHAAKSPGEDPKVTLGKAQEAMDTWEGILRATGGVIGVNDDTKAFWYFLDFKFAKGQWKYKNKEDLPGTLQVRSQQGTATNLARLEPSMARETLGVFMAMDGNQREQKHRLMEKARLYNEQLRTGVITRQHAWYSYTTSFSKTLEYPMEAIDMSKGDWDDILKIFLGTLLNKAGLLFTVFSIILRISLLPFIICNNLTSSKEIFVSSSLPGVTSIGFALVFSTSIVSTLINSTALASPKVPRDPESSPRLDFLEEFFRSNSPNSIAKSSISLSDSRSDIEKSSLLATLCSQSL